MDSAPGEKQHAFRRNLVAREAPKENTACTLVLLPAPRTLILGEMGPLDALGEGCQR